MSDTDKLDHLMQFVAALSNGDNRIEPDPNHQPEYNMGWNQAVKRIANDATDVLQLLERG